jgi:hypothetical protein
METKTKNNKKQFDAIKIMREIRDKLNLEIMNMSYEQERVHLDNILAQAQNQSAK